MHAEGQRFEPACLHHFLEQMMKLKEGQKVRVFGIIKDSWVLGEVKAYGEASVTVAIYDWVGIPPAFYTIPYDQIEVIGGGI